MHYQTHKLVMLPSLHQNINNEAQIMKVNNNDFLYLASELRDKIKKFNGFPFEYFKHINSSPQHLYVLSDEPIKRNDWFYESLNKKNIQQFIGGQLVYTSSKKIIASTDPLLKELPTFIHTWLNIFCECIHVDEVEIAYHYIGGIAEQFKKKELLIGDKNHVTAKYPNLKNLNKTSWSKEEVMELLTDCWVASQKNARQQYDGDHPYFEEWAKNKL